MLDKIDNSINELKHMMQIAPSLVDKALVQSGENTIAIYFDNNFGPKIENYQNLKIKMLRTALIDLVSGGSLLKSRKMGLVFKDNRLVEYNSPYSEKNPNGQVVASISLKSMRAFDGFRTKNEQEHVLSDDQKNAAIYYLVYMLSKNEA